MTATRDELVGRLVDGRYRVRAHLADGGMGSVYVALDERLDRQVALKVMRPDLARDAGFVERFRREARAAAQLTNPHVVAVYDQGQDEDVVFLAMEYVPGRTLRARLDSEGALVPREALRLQRQILQALGSAHRAGIVHRDVKPENVLLTESEQVKVADFGLARAVSTVTTSTLGPAAFGTVCYLAPEQVESARADARSDVYAAGLVLFELLTGRRAVDGDTPIQVAYRHVHGAVPAPSSARPGLAHPLDALVASATRRDPSERPEDAAAFLAELDRAAAILEPAELDLPAPGRMNPAGPQFTDRLVRPTQPVPMLAGSVGSAGLSAAGGAGAGAASEVSPAPGVPGEDATGSGARVAPVAVGDAGGGDEPPPTGAHRDAADRRPGPVRKILLALLAALVLVGGGVGWYQFLGPGSARVVPKVAGLTQDQAVASLAAQDLRADLRPTFSDDVKSGIVISADPGEGAEARRATAVALAVSKGPDVVTVPDVAGRSEEATRAALQDARLTVGSRSEDFSETVAAGQVIGTAPKAGETLRAGKPVGYVVSKGRKPFEVADWTGKPLADLQKSLDAAGIRAQVTEEFSTDVPKGVVIKQSPTSGTLYRGDQLALTVSKGPDLVPVPVVQGKPEAEARAALEKAGFRVQIDRILGGVFGTARATDPSGGTSAPRGSTVTLRVV
jgi:beta-lactam-binding protein with PASTA domain/predicted Ser/Thr protein kinase